MTESGKGAKTKAELEAELLALTREVEALRLRGSGAVPDSQRRMAETLHNLQVHQEELRAQNDELRQAHDTVAKMTDRYRDLFEYSPIGYFIIDDHFAVIDANIGAISMLGRTKRRVAGKPFLLFCDQDWRPHLDAHFATVRNNGRASTELWLTPEGVASFPVILESVRLGDGWGGGWRCLTTAMDITGRQKAERALKESETRFRAIFEQSPLAIEIVDSNAIPRMSNGAWTRLWGTGSTVATPLGSHHGLGAIGVERHLAEGLAGRVVEIPATRVDDRWIHGYVYPIRGEDNSVPEVVLVHEDISERKQIELALVERTELLRRQYENLRVLGEIAALPPAGAAQRLAEALELARQHLGLAIGVISRFESGHFNALHRAPADLTDGESDPALASCARVMAANDVVASTEAEEGQIGAPIQIGGKVHGVLCFYGRASDPQDFDDGDKEFMRLLARWIGAVLEEDSVRRDLARSNAELEQFAYVASHDLRQPLRQVASFVALLSHRYADKLDADGQEFIAFAQEGAARMDRLIIDLLDLARIGNSAKEAAPMSLTEVVNGAIANLGTAIGESGGRVEVISQLPLVKSAGSDLLRLFQNLIGNAIKYRLPDRPPIVTVSAETRATFHVITVRDNGIGIKPEHFDTIFGVFKRLHTQDKYDGTGIGLAICKKVVDQHHGKIRVESVPGEGTAFHIELPRLV